MEGPRMTSTICLLVLCCSMMAQAREPFRLDCNTALRSCLRFSLSGFRAV
ncbi:hypothetical protein QJQ45_025413 [Haematococcus lacustris]|nr:hypothetical protein QJQ45_025413 [Haematococcus lacustris]